MAIKKSELYSSLWAGCDELRGGMDASQYKDYVLVLLFMKYVSDKAASQKGYLLDLPLIEKWEAKIGMKIESWGVRRMKTKWGSCNIVDRRIWLNLELAKKPIYCLEYILVHEMVHLIERHHNDQFTILMDQFLPNWRQRRDELNHAPLAHETWSY